MSGHRAKRHGLGCWSGTRSGGAYGGGMARPSAVLLVAALAVGALTACDTTEPTRSAPPPSSTYTTSLADLQDKVDAIAQDNCTTRPAVQVYLDCARYVAEVGNAALATRDAASSVAGSGQLGATASRLADEVGQFSKDGCVAAPGVAGPPAQTCGDALRRIQLDLTAMRTQLDDTARRTPRTRRVPTFGTASPGSRHGESRISTRGRHAGPTGG